MAHLEHESLGVSIDIPAIRQRDMEALMEAYRRVKRKRDSGRKEVIEQTADDIMAAILSAQLRKLKAGDDGLRQLAETAAEGIAQRMSQTPLDDVTNQEDAGNWARAAASLGWITDTSEDGVGDMVLPAVLWIAGQLLEALTEARTVPNA